MLALVVSLIALGLPQNAGSNPAGAELTTAEITHVLAEARSALERATAAQEAGDPATARAEAVRVVELLAPLPLGEGHDDTASVLWRVGYVAHGAGDLSCAREAWGRVLSHRERTLPADHSDLLAARQNLALTIEEWAEPPEAEAPESRAEEVVGIPEELRQALADVTTLRDEGDLDAARERLAAVLEDEAYARLLVEEHDVVLEGLSAIDATAGSLGALEVQLRIRRAAVERLGEVHDSDHPARLAAEQDLALTLWDLGELEGALERFETVHAVRERHLASDDPDLLRTRGNLAGVRSELGDLEGALALEEQVHEARERLLPGDHPDLLAAKVNLAVTRMELGDLTGSHELLEHVYTAWGRLLPVDHPDLLTAKQNLAVTRKKLGDLEGALDLEEQVLVSRGRLLPPDHPDLLAAALNLAVTRYELGDVRGVIELLEDVHATWQRLLPPDHPDLLSAKQDLAVLRAELGDLEGALELGEEVLEARERRLPPDHLDVLAAKENLAMTRDELGDLEGALELQEQVHAARERLLPPDHPDLLTTKLRLAVVRRARGDLDGALEITCSLLEGQLVRVASLRGDSPRVARAAALQELDRISRALSWSEPTVAGAQHRLDGLLFSVLESLRLVSTSSSEIALAASRSQELMDLVRARTEVRGELSDWVHSHPEGATELTTWRKRFVELTDERDRIESELRDGLTEKGVHTDSPTSSAVAKGLEESSALVSYFRYARFLDDRPRTDGARPPVDSLLAFVVTPDASIQRVDLGPCVPIEANLNAWRAALEQPIRGRGVAASSSALGPESGEDAGGRLRSLVLDPILAVVPDVRTLHVVADDFLHLVPLDALPLENGLVGTRLAVRYESTVRRLMRPDPLLETDARLVVVGGVDYAAEGVAGPVLAFRTTTPPVARARYEVGTREGALEEHFAALQGTLRELEEIAGLFRQRFEIEPVVLRGAEADKTALHEEASGARYLHLATHGWFALERFQSMIDGLEEEQVDLQTAFYRADDTIRGFAPETLCGLALAGANRGMNELGHVPGIVTAEELATLDLTSCELAVLSACETNVGLRRAGQGIQSLQTALHIAGARTAITSLWKVDDQWTRGLMTEFYRLIWIEERPKAEALWEAKMRIRERGADLVDWAGWVLTGDPE